MEIKVLCPCGSKYKFDVEPLHGKLPGPVQCPVCGADGTEAGNRFVAEALAGGRAGPVPVQSGSAIVIPAVPRSSRDIAQSSTGQGSAPNSPAPVSSNSLAPQPGGTGTKLSVTSVHASAPAPVASIASEPPPSAPLPPAARSASPPRSTGYSGPSNRRGLIGAAVGGFVGMIIWAGLIVLTDREIGWIAWGVGGLTGFAARSIGRGTSPQIGFAAAVAALIAIIGGQFLATRHAVNTFVDKAVKEGYDGHIAYAKEAVNAKTDPEIKAFLVKNQEMDGETSAITDADVEEFKREQLPNLRKAASGELSRSEFERTNREAFNSVFSTSRILMSSLSLWTLLWIFLGVGSAYRLGSNG